MANRLLLDIGGTYIRIGYKPATEKQPSLLSQTEAHLRNGKQAFLTQLRALLSNSIKTLQREYSEDVQHICIAVPGHVDMKSHIVSFPPAFDGLQNIDLASELSDLFFDKKIMIENDANARAFGEYNALMQQDEQLTNSTIVVITLGTGFGAGIVVDGKLMRGFYGKAGEIGYMHLTHNMEVITSRVRDYCSGTGLTRLDKYLRNQVGKEAAIADTSTPEAICQKALEGDPFAQKVWHIFIELLSLIIFDLFCVLDPYVVIIGGGVTKAKIFDFEKLQGLVSQKASGLMSSIGGFRISPSNLGDYGGLHGLATMPL